MYTIRCILDRTEYIILINNIVKRNHQFLKIFSDYISLCIKYMQILQICHRTSEYKFYLACKLFLRRYSFPYGPMTHYI